jgi:hypothetical protein
MQVARPQLPFTVRPPFRTRGDMADDKAEQARGFFEASVGDQPAVQSPDGGWQMEFTTTQDGRF